ncbi:MarR family transcriptional regulator [Kibdelosporangium aridum]|uniref:MarR family transcriptional regulator n=1 Tax=Kibdelosporangium aridum TaxID=2030 RepID=A0A428ZB43_KIBAR|nr:MarR family winged helix-turn-helix transcriptional regulator [Kibdelosporangium aridum]RSM85266.1 MarR family transcriptional regulator [Kibdelosporangium aridum]
MGTIPIQQPTIDVGSDLDAVTTAVADASQVLLTVTDQAVATVASSVTTAQFRMMMVLHSCGPRTVGGLAGCVGQHASTVTRTVGKLIKAGYAVRRLDPQKRRGTLIVLTPAGTALVNAVHARRRRAIARIVADMSARDRRELTWALGALRNAARSLSARRSEVSGGRP